MLGQVARKWQLLPRLASPNLIQQVKPGSQIGREIRYMSYYSREFSSVKGGLSGKTSLEGLVSKLESTEKEIPVMEEADKFSSVKEMLDKSKEVSQNVSEFVKNTANSVNESEIVNKAKTEGISGIAQTVTDAAKNVAQNVKEGFEKVTDAVTNAVPNPFQGKWENNQIEQEKRLWSYEEALKREQTESHDSNVLREYAWGPSWEHFRANDPVITSIFAYDDGNQKSDFFRSTKNKLTSSFSDTKAGIQEIQSADQSFDIDAVLRAMKNYTIPVILESYFNGKKEELKQWTSDDLFASLVQDIDQRKESIDEKAQIMDARVKIKEINPVYAKLVNNRPVMVLSFKTDQAVLKKDEQGKVIEGDEAITEEKRYAAALVKEGGDNPITGGWRFLEIALEPNFTYDQKNLTNENISDIRYSTATKTPDLESINTNFIPKMAKEEEADSNPDIHPKVIKNLVGNINTLNKKLENEEFHDSAVIDHPHKEAEAMNNLNNESTAAVGSKSDNMFENKNVHDNVHQQNLSFDEEITMARKHNREHSQELMEKHLNWEKKKEREKKEKVGEKEPVSEKLKGKKPKDKVKA